MADSKQHPIIAVTGTKGKTSLVRVIDYVLAAFYDDVVRVDTSGAYYNGKLAYSDDDSRKIWGYAVTNAPGRFITLRQRKPGISILEATLFSARTGLAYKKHDIGMFTNVYRDHIGPYSGINSSEEIAQAKSFIFSRIKPDGWAIYNDDDKLVKSMVAKIPAGVKQIAVSLSQSSTKSRAEYTCYYHKDTIRLTRHGKVLIKVPVSNFEWLDTRYQPSLYLATFAVAAIFAQLPARQHAAAIKRLGKYTFDIDGGRMVKVKTNNKPTVIMDYAHEEESLQALADYARSLVGPKGKVVGVLRLAPSRPQIKIEAVATAIYQKFDEFIIYDKIDGHWRKAGKIKGLKDKSEQVGLTARAFSAALRQLGNKPIRTILREDAAILEAVGLASETDVITYIVGDNTKRSHKFLKDALA